MAPKKKVKRCLQATNKKVTEHREDDPESWDEVAPGNKDGSGDEVEGGLKHNLEDAIADFYEANPLFFKIRVSQTTKSRRKRESSCMEQFCRTSGMGTKPEDIARRFKSHRTEYVRLKRLKIGKSGAEKVSHQPTTLETAALSVPRPLLCNQTSRRPGIGSKSRRGEEVDDEEAGRPPVALPLSGPLGRGRVPCPNGRTPIKKKPATTPSISDVLARFLHGSDKEKKRAQQEVKNITKEAQEKELGRV
ncbi:hypothetical protein Bbelb_281600 [Branchiostoma belcheri]|nr:hypothetical protein Bbelb_281600 [Branchiostoma belcheri]